MRLFFEIIKIISSIIHINIKNIFAKFQNKNNYFFYHPRENLTLIHTYYTEDIFSLDKRYSIIYGHKLNKNLGANYFYIRENYLKFIFFVDIFISNNVCDKFTFKSKKIYIHHNIYDAPLVDSTKEKKLCERLFQYDFIFLPNKNSVEMMKTLLNKYKSEKLVKMPHLKNVGYAKLDFLESKIRNIKTAKNSILIAPTNFYGFPKFTLINELKIIIENLLKKTNLNIILRPHPSNREDEKIIELKKIFKNEKNFSLDFSENYLETYSRSKILITDLSATAYTYSFLTFCPVIFYSKMLVEDHHKNLNYFKNRNKIGVMAENIYELEQSIELLINSPDRLIDSIKEIKKEIVYIGKAKEKIHTEIDLILN